MWGPIKGELFSFRGYCTREEFGTAYFGVQVAGAAVVVLLFCVTMDLTNDNAQVAIGLAGVVYLPVFVAGVATSCRRLQDIGISGAPAVLVAVVSHNGLVCGLVLWMIPGELERGGAALPQLGGPFSSQMSS